MEARAILRMVRISPQKARLVADQVRGLLVGNAANLLPAIFNLFTQVDQSLNRSQGGLGIGLGLVRKLMEMHGGTVRAESEGHGLGSMFTLNLPT